MHPFSRSWMHLLQGLDYPWDEPQAYQEHTSKWLSSCHDKLRYSCDYSQKNVTIEDSDSSKVDRVRRKAGDLTVTKISGKLCISIPCFHSRFGIVYVGTKWSNSWTCLLQRTRTWNTTNSPTYVHSSVSPPAADFSSTPNNNRSLAKVKILLLQLHTVRYRNLQDYTNSSSKRKELLYKHLRYFRLFPLPLPSQQNDTAFETQILSIFLLPGPVKQSSTKITTLAKSKDIFNMQLKDIKNSYNRLLLAATNHYQESI
jgi:hypothetical protein